MYLHALFAASKCQFFPVPSVIIASEMDPHYGSYDEASLTNWQEKREPCDVSSCFINKHARGKVTFCTRHVVY